jgi:hypothetical protein
LSITRLLDGLNDSGGNFRERSTLLFLDHSRSTKRFTNVANGSHNEGDCIGGGFCFVLMPILWLMSSIELVFSLAAP